MGVILLLGFPRLFVSRVRGIHNPLQVGREVVDPPRLIDAVVPVIRHQMGGVEVQVVALVRGSKQVLNMPIDRRNGPRVPGCRVVIAVSGN